MVSFIEQIIAGFVTLNNFIYPITFSLDWLFRHKYLG